ncbi:Kef-type K+ transport system membrane component KefB [Saccharothrix tamanrassetensis]|uniref:Kef-type K+ transport system membrane component KefB n=1 Tax=Saccharothrix tamanrassetensis TaxID=1051531 RepID=A0A841CN02_9PSEU|nr:cation:proton antiporter [Saccharothrix tamanrassetensis]MBB5956926.1 Kef-type K+ transport system membrane component KefB [Saccharothrix tamanrassetensis]
MTIIAAPPSPIAAHQMLIFLLQLTVLLGVAFALGKLAARFNLPAVVGELAAGVLLGPSLLAHAIPPLSDWLFPADPNQIHLLDAVGQLGVLLLVGFTGMHIDMKLVRRKGRTAAWVSAGGLFIPLALGVGVGLVLPADLLGGERGEHLVFALFLGVAMCVSAIPVIAKTLLELKLLHRNIGQLTISAAAVDDIVGWSLLSVVSAMATTGLRAGHVALTVGSLVAVLLVAVLVGRPLVKAGLTVANKSEDAGVTVAVVVLLLLASAAGTHALGLEPILGTFLCGILLGTSGLLNRTKLAPLRTFVMAVLAPIFFATAGLRMDLTLLAEPAVLLAALAVLAIAIGGKFVGAYLGARLSRLTHWEGLALGAGLNARGVIEVIVAMVGLRLGVLTTAGYTIIVLVAVVTSLMAPPMLRYAVRRIEVTDEERERERTFAG